MLAGLRILVVEDERGVRLLVSRILTEAGASVTPVASFEEAAEVFEQAPPDVLISDIRMPAGTGYDLIRWVRSRPPEQGGGCLAVAISASVAGDEMDKVTEAGFQAFLRKPFQPSELREAVARLAGRTPR